MEIGRLEAYRELLVHLHEPVLVVRRTGEIVAGNVAAADALGATIAALVGGTLDAFSPDQPIDLPRQAAQSMSFHLRARDGRRFSGDTSVLAPDLFLVRLTGNPDATQRTRALFEMFARQQPIQLAGDRPPLAELARTLLAVGMTSVGSNAGGIFLLDASGRTLELVASVGYPPDIADRYRLVPVDAQIPLTASVRSMAPVFLGTPEEYRTHYSMFTAANPRIVERAMACIPLVVDGRCIGTLGLGFTLPWPFTAVERRYLLELGHHFAQALERARRNSAAPNESRLAKLQAFTSALARAITPAEVAEVAVDAGMAATAARTGGLWLITEDGLHANLARAVGSVGPLPEQHVRVPLDWDSRMPILDALQAGSPVWIESRAQFEKEYPDAFRRFCPPGETSLACVPLLAQGRCIGGLVYNFDHPRKFDEDERAFFQVLAWYAAQAIDRARLYAMEKRTRAEAEASQRRSAFLADSDALLASLDSQSVLAAAAAMTVPRIADSCVIELEEERARGLPAHTTRVDPAGEAPVVSAMEVAISARGRTLGTMRLESTTVGRHYDPHDIAMAEDLGRKVGLVLENARLYREVRDADRLKDEFLAMLSHELRNPLVPIVTAVELMNILDSSAFPNERGMIQRNVRHLMRLIDDLLDVSRITRNKVVLQRVPCEAAALISAALEIAQPTIAQREHRLVVSVPVGGLPVFADRVRMPQAIANLLTNAAKYTDPGGTIHVDAGREDNDVVIRVRDTGIGIAPELLPSIFKLFVQVSNASDRSQGGLGIGLTVVHAIVELHGGSVAAHSAGLGHGSELVIRLPPHATAVDTVAAAEPVPRAPETLRVLVVEDNHDAATLLGALLRAVGCTALIKHDGNSALAAVADFKPELALLDLGLPNMDGFELARRLRELDGTLRIVAITGYGQEADRVKTREAGFDEHLVKPVELDILRRVLAERKPQRLQ